MTEQPVVLLNAIFVIQWPPNSLKMAKMRILGTFKTPQHSFLSEASPKEGFGNMF